MNFASWVTMFLKSIEFVAFQSIDFYLYFIDRRNADSTRAGIAWESSNNDQQAEWGRAPVRWDSIYFTTVSKLPTLITVLCIFICNWNQQSEILKIFMFCWLILSWNLFICSLFNNTDSSWDCIVLNESVIINNKLERVWKEQLLLVWDTLHFVSQARFEVSISQV